MRTATDQARLLQALLDPALYGQGERVEHLETHISHVFLAGEFAYKVKKPVDLGFLDFRTLDARRFYCDEELRLNRRLAPSLYLDVVAITGSAEHPVLGGEGPAIEYAVRMRRMPQEALLGRVLARGELTPERLDELADQIAAFHSVVAVASAADAYATPEVIRRAALANFAALGEAARELSALERWTVERCEALQPVFVERKAGGSARECHGDLHLGNIALFEDAITIFDCLEFNPSLRWIDVMSEAAFLAMDLEDHGRSDLAHRFVNRYLERTGDYGGLSVLRFYVVYRAMVRAKVHYLRAGQAQAGEDRRRLSAQYEGYVDLARRTSQGARTALLITHGLSGSGKTTGTQSLLEDVGAVRICSDIERKRLHGLPARAVTRSGPGAGIYSSASTERTYRRLEELARLALASGHPVLVDATFLAHEERARFRRMADDAGAPFVILDFAADESVLRERILARTRAAEDASEADLSVLERQRAIREPLEADERACAVAADGDWSRLRGRLGW